MPWIYDENDKKVYVTYDELDDDILHKLWKPVGGFCYSAESFTHLALPRVPFYLENWIPKMGKSLIYGSAKGGKSFTATQIARCIGTGVPFLGIPTEQGRVLYIQLEMGEEVLQGRMKTTGKSYDNVFVGTTFAMKLDKKTGREQLIQALSDIRPDVLILDPFIKIISGEENESHDVCIITDFLDEMIATYECSILILHHAGKDKSKGGRGSSVLEGWVDSYIELSKIGDDPLQIRLKPKLLRHSSLPPEPIEAELKDNEFIQIEPKKPIIQAVAEYIHLRSSEGHTTFVNELLGAGIGSRRSIYDALDALRRRGVVAGVKRGEVRWVGGDDKQPLQLGGEDASNNRGLDIELDV